MICNIYQNPFYAEATFFQGKRMQKIDNNLKPAILVFIEKLSLCTHR